MAYVMIRCPVSTEKVFTRKMATEASFETDSFEGSAVRCPVCDSIHHWGKADAWLQPLRTAPQRSDPA